MINGSIYLYEGEYIKAGLNFGTATATIMTGLPVAKAAAKGLNALGASEKVVKNVSCAIGTAAHVAPHAAVAVLSVADAKQAYDKGNYVEATLSIVSGGASLFRAANVGKYCFTEGTQVVVGMEYDVDGNFVSYVTQNIEDIKVGDLVYSYDTTTCEVSQKAVISTSALRSDHINYLTIIDEHGVEQTIETTDTHPFWVVTDEPDLERAARDYVFENDVWKYHENITPTVFGFWVEAKDLRVGDVFLGANGELSTLTNIVRVEQAGGINVFNFEVEGNHNYFVIAKNVEGGTTAVLAHNMCAKKKTKSNTSPGHDPPPTNFSRGRTTPKNEAESAALQRIKADPTLGKDLPITLNDPACPAGLGWVKVEYKEGNVVIHYVYNIFKKIATDFKFK